MEPVKLREALILQAPSLALQRAAADEIAKQDGEIRELRSLLQKVSAELEELRWTYESLRK